MIAITVALATLVGLSLGLLGGGGSILMVPLLAYVANVDAKQAIATSLLVVGVTSVVGIVTHARAGRVRYRTGILFGAAGMAGAYLGGIGRRGRRHDPDMPTGHILPASGAIPPGVRCWYL